MAGPPASPTELHRGLHRAVRPARLLGPSTHASFQILIPHRQQQRRRNSCNCSTVGLPPAASGPSQACHHRLISRLSCTLAIPHTPVLFIPPVAGALETGHALGHNRGSCSIRRKAECSLLAALLPSTPRGQCGTHTARSAGNASADVHAVSRCAAGVHAAALLPGGRVPETGQQQVGSALLASG